MSHVAGKTEIRNRAGYESIIQFLCVINLVPSGNTANMKALEVRIRKVARGDIDRIIDIEHPSPAHWRK